MMGGDTTVCLGVGEGDGASTDTVGCPDGCVMVGRATGSRD